MKASIIIPSFNSSERLYLNLISLKYQDYPHDDFEVIVIDNGSSDDTKIMLANFAPNFPLKTIYIEKNLGIARGRNKGILEASGDILIFHDSDMIASKNFVRKHIEAHEKENIVVCGLPWLRIYSFFYKTFTITQMEDFRRHIDNCNLSNGHWENSKLNLISEQQIKDGSFLNFCFDLEANFIDSLKDTITSFGLDLKNYNLPWRFFITNNASVERSKVIELGMFDENIIKYGFEDYDLGIRLFKTKSQFKLSPDIISAHQEHPKNATPNDTKENILYLCKKYNSNYFIDVLLVSLSFVIPLEYTDINNIMNDINFMHNIGQYNKLLNIFVKMLITTIHLSLGQDTNNKVTITSDMYRNLFSIKNQLKELIEVHSILYFPSVFSILSKNAFSIYL